MDKPASVGILGASGRMGVIIQALIEKDYAKDFALTAKVSKDESLDPLKSCDVIIDFSAPEAVLELLKTLEGTPGSFPALVIGSTGWKLDQRNLISQVSQKTPVVMASNFSLGVMAFTEILKTASPLLESLGYNPVILETHHRHKKDAPSGTALSLQRVVSPSGPGNVPTYSVRAGEVIGEHEIWYHGADDRILFAHYAQDRNIFARGAIEAGRWLFNKKKADPNFKGLQGIDTFFQETYVRK